MARHARETRAATAVSPDPVVAGILERSAVAALLQPVVDLTTSQPVGFEALARGPLGHPLEDPQALFAAARAEGLLTELDAACVAAALHAARRSGARDPWTLFVNLEPDSRTAEVLPAAAPEGLRVVVELTERALLADPAAVLRTVDHIRELGWGVALDDVGADPASLALLPLLRPDVIKLDARVVQDPPSPVTAALFSAVSAEAERTGALVLAEGIETEAHLAAAHAVGAHLGQGWLFGRPTSPEAATLATSAAGEGIRLDLSSTCAPEVTPFALAAAARPTWRSDGALLFAMSRHLERFAAQVGEAAVVMTTFQRAEAFRPAADRYAALARGGAFVAALGVGLDLALAPGVRWVDLDPADPLAPEWDLVVLGPHFSALLAARPAPGEDPAGRARDTVFDDVLTHDRPMVVDGARALASRVSRSHGADARAHRRVPELDGPGGRPRPVGRA